MSQISSHVVAGQLEGGPQSAAGLQKSPQWYEKSPERGRDEADAVADLPAICGDAATDTRDAFALTAPRQLVLRCFAVFEAQQGSSLNSLFD